MGAALKRRQKVAETTAREQADTSWANLGQWMLSTEALKLSLSEVEREQEERSREANRLLLQAHMDQRGRGDVGEAVEVVEGKTGRKKRTRRHAERRVHGRKVLSVFGLLVIRRLAYHADGASSIHPLDEQAQLPARKFSYQVQRRTVLGMIQSPYDEALEGVQEWTGLRISKESAEAIFRNAASDFDAFYEGRNRSLPPPSKTGTILVAGADCKGVPMAHPEKDLRVVTVGKNERDNKKRMATVATVYTQVPRVRTPEDVAESLFRPRSVPRDPEAPRWPGPENKRVWASLLKEKDKVFVEIRHEVKHRDPRGEKLLAVLTDGEHALQLRAARELKRAIAILDLMHALQRLWACGRCFHPKGSAECEQLVKAWTLEILRGKVSQVVKGIRCSATKQRLPEADRQAIQDATQYLLNNKARMKYDEYLALGLPIASGAVEGACKNIVNDRMERSGMRWALSTPDATSEAMLRLRAIYLSGDFNEYWAFHVRGEQQRLHPKGRWAVAS